RSSASATTGPTCTRNCPTWAITPSRREEVTVPTQTDIPATTAPAALPVVPARPVPARGDDRVVISPLGWPAYVTISDALPERTHVRTGFVDGRMTLLVTSRRHDWHAETLGDLLKAVANACGILWAAAGSATLRRPDVEVGVEGDKVFYLGPNAAAMR